MNRHLIAINLASFLAACLWLPGALFAEDALQTAEQEQTELNQDTAAMQRRIDSLDDETRRLLDEYRKVSAELAQTQRYNQELTAKTEAQNERISRLQQQIGTIEQTREAITPFMAAMADKLVALLELDLPFQHEARLADAKALREQLYAPDSTPAQAFREILRAYRDELKHGRRIATYRGQIEIEGESRNVAFLRIGRLALFYRTLDGQRQGQWDRNSQRWQALPGRYGDAIEQGIRIAKEQAAPEMLTLPMPAPQEDDE